MGVDGLTYAPEDASFAQLVQLATDEPGQKIVSRSPIEAKLAAAPQFKDFESNTGESYCRIFLHWTFQDTDGTISISVSDFKMYFGIDLPESKEDATVSLEEFYNTHQEKSYKLFLSCCQPDGSEYMDLKMTQILFKISLTLYQNKRFLFPSK